MSEIIRVLWAPKKNVEKKQLAGCDAPAETRKETLPYQSRNWKTEGFYEGLGHNYGE